MSNLCSHINYGYVDVLNYAEYIALLLSSIWQHNLSDSLIYLGITLQFSYV